MPRPPRDAEPRRPRPRGSRARLAGVLAGAVLLTTACSGSDDQPGAQQSPTATPTPGAALAAPLRVRAGAVAGTLPQADRRAAVAAVGEVVDGWLEAAYVGGDWPRSDAASSFPGFTRGAAARARKQAGLLSNAAVGDRIESVAVDRKVARVDLFATDGRAVGATARVRLLFTTTGAYAQQVRVIGRLFLTPVEGSWKVFGYDVRKAEL